eukprot:m.223848 g.223848  ORF g.223848 m.223848 type:complete len:155 (+) comp39986_c0_seq20:685-1149(+)
MAVTEMEILHGAYRRRNPNALFMLREPSFSSAIPKDLKYLFVDSNPDADEKLAALKTLVRGGFPDQVLAYAATFSSVNTAAGMVELKGLEEFKLKVVDFFKRKIEACYWFPLENETLDKMTGERTVHEVVRCCCRMTELAQYKQFNTYINIMVD